MRRLLTDASVLKPAGGVAEVVLTPVSNIREVRYNASGTLCRPPDFLDITRCLQPPLVEGRSRFEQRSEGPPEAELVTHTLTLALDPGDAASLTGNAAAAAIRAEGAVAVIRTESGHLLLCGHSARLGGEQPLRPLETDYDSGSGLRERPLTLLRFRSADTDPSAEIASDDLPNDRGIPSDGPAADTAEQETPQQPTSTAIRP